MLFGKFCALFYCLLFTLLQIVYLAQRVHERVQVATLSQRLKVLLILAEPVHCLLHEFELVNVV